MSHPADQTGQRGALRRLGDATGRHRPLPDRAVDDERRARAARGPAACHRDAYCGIHLFSKAPAMAAVHEPAALPLEERVAQSFARKVKIFTAQRSRRIRKGGLRFARHRTFA